MSREIWHQLEMCIETNRTIEVHETILNGYDEFVFKKMAWQRKSLIYDMFKIFKFLNPVRVF